MKSLFVWFVVVTGGALLVSLAVADTVVLKNGDTIKGTVGQVAGGKMKFTSPVLGDITIDMENVTSYKTDAPATIRLKDGQAITQPITAGDAAKVTAGGKDYTDGQVKIVNPPPQAWTGTIVANGSIEHGNTNTMDLGIDANAMLRRDDTVNDDRFSLVAKYNFGRTGSGPSATTTTDNWEASAKYDKFWTEKLYGYANIKYEHDRIANLEYRLTPGIGIGYQWIEQPDMNFNTEAGISYVYEEYIRPWDQQEHLALRLAYHFDKKLNDWFSIFHNLEYLPAFEDPGDYNLTTDAGFQANMTKTFFTQFKVEWKRDSTPAENSLKNDLKYLLGVGWRF